MAAKTPRKIPISSSMVSATARGSDTEKAIRSISTIWKLHREKTNAMTKIMAKNKRTKYLIAFCRYSEVNYQVLANQLKIDFLSIRHAGGNFSCIGQRSEAPSAIWTPYGGWRFAYPPYPEFSVASEIQIFSLSIFNFAFVAGLIDSVTELFSRLEMRNIFG